MKVIVALFLAAALSSSTAAEDPCDDGQCEAGCVKNFAAAGVEACKRGCRLFRLGNASDSMSMAGGGGPGVLDHCRGDCKKAYGDGREDCVSCCNGCDLQATCAGGGGGGVEVFSFALPRFMDVSGLFGGNNAPGNFFGVPLFGGRGRQQQGEEEDVGVGAGNNIFERFQNRVAKMMGSIMNGPMFGGSSLGMPAVHGGGDIVVIKEENGVRQEKTYHVPPNADIERIIGTTMDDMMNHKNPMEKFEHLTDVEIFDPAAVMNKNGKEDGDGGNHEERANDGEVGLNDLRHFDTDPWGLLEVPIEEQPRLPENGLRSRFAAGQSSSSSSEPEDFDVGRFVIVENSVCSKDTSKMGWSDWLACLHVRMGLPNWLLAASVAIGVLFAMWLCMVIPSGAPKQRVRKAKMLNTKEVEASEIYTIVPCDGSMRKVDLPPSYDDVTKTNELEPVHEKQIKIALAVNDEDDDEIVEPLPEKKGVESGV